MEQRWQYLRLCGNTNSNSLKAKPLRDRVEAQRRAREEVKAQIRRDGRIKLSEVPSREITALAEAYVLVHPELIAEAKETVLRWHAEGMFGPRGGIRNPVRRAS